DPPPARRSRSCARSSLIRPSCTVRSRIRWRSRTATSCRSTSSRSPTGSSRCRASRPRAMTATCASANGPSPVGEPSRSACAALVSWAASTRSPCRRAATRSARRSRSHMGGDIATVFFRDAGEFRAWLEEHHASETELWIELRGKDSPDRGLTWAEAVPEALCFGWIDSVSYPHGEGARRQRWTPRKARSTWSKINIAHVERLLAEGRMHPAGIAAYERRTSDNSGVYSFENADAPLAPELQAIIDASPAAAAFLAEATPGYRKTVRHWVSSAKQD